MNYLFLAIAVIGISMQLVFTKLYQKKAGDTVFHTLLFNMTSALFSMLLFLCLSGFKLRFTGFSIVMALILAVIFSANGLLAIKICSMGNVAVYTLFLMLGGMTLPFIYGVVCLKESASAFRYVALVILMAALLFQCLDSGKGRKGRNNKLFFLCCALIFLTNGTASVVSKMHQDPAWLRGLGLGADNVDTNIFLVFTYFFMVVLNGAVFLGYLLLNKKKGNMKAEAGEELAGKTGITSMTGKEFGRAIGIIAIESVFSSVGYLMQLLGARNLDASLLYPIVTGGTIVLGAVLGRVIFHEKIQCYGIIGVALAFVSTLLFAF